MAEKDRLDTIYKICCDKRIFFKYDPHSRKNSSRYKNKSKKSKEIENKRKLEKKKLLINILNIIQNSDLIKPAEQILIDMYFLNPLKKTQREIAYVLRVQQAYISKLIRRMLDKVAVLYYRSQLNDDYVKNILNFLDEKHLSTLIIYLKEINQERVARIIKKKQTTVSVRLNKIKNKIGEYIRSERRKKKAKKIKLEKVKKFLEFFNNIRQYNFYPNFSVRSSDKHIKKSDWLAGINK